MLKQIILGAILCLASCSSPTAKTDDCGPAPGGDCDNWVCDDGAWQCDAIDKDCESDPRVGTTCGETCGGGVFVCDQDDNVVCVGSDDGSANACGGCDSLGGDVGDPCGDCGEMQCVGENSLSCMEPATGCVACEPDLGLCDAACAVSFWECVNDEQSCNTDACFVSPLGEPCVENDQCESATCGNGFCSPPGYVYVPADTFTMGAPLGEPGLHPARENGQHDVTITRAMFVKQTAVTQADWEAMFEGANPSYFINCGPDCPIERVNMFEMFLYANMLSESEGLTACYNLITCTPLFLNTGCSPNTRAGLRCANNTYTCDETAIEPGLDCNGYRLLTESEWEYVARAGTTDAFLTETGTYLDWSATVVDPEMDKIAWYYANGSVAYETDFNCAEPETRIDCNDFGPEINFGTHPVAQKLPNAWGLYDMSGNIWERTWDIRTDYPEPGTLVVDPTGPPITVAGDVHAMRGGPFNSNGQYLRVAYRTGPAARSRFYNLGFRLTRSILNP